MGIVDNANIIIKGEFFACARPQPMLIVEAAAQALGPVLINFATFGCLDIIKMRAGISPWHKRGAIALIKGAIPGEQIDEVGKAIKFLIPLEKLLFTWFVADLTVEFFARWQSQIFRLGACNPPVTEKTASGPLASYVCPSKDVWARIAYSLTYPQGTFGSSTDFAVPAGWFFTAFFELKVDAILPIKPVTSMQIRLRSATTIGTGFYGAINKPPWFGNTIKGGLHFQMLEKFGTFREWVFEATCDNPAIGVGGSCAISIAAKPLANQDIIPVNCFGGPAPGVHQA